MPQFLPQRKHKSKSINCENLFSVKRTLLFARALGLAVSIECGRKWAQRIDCSSNECRRWDAPDRNQVRFDFENSCRCYASPSREHVGVAGCTYHICVRRQHVIEHSRSNLRINSVIKSSSPWVTSLWIIDWIQLILIALMAHFIHHGGRLEGKR